MKSKNKILTVFSVICFVIGILEIAYGLIVCCLDIGQEAVQSIINSIEDAEILNSEEGLLIVKYVIGAIYILEGLFFLIEGALIRRASKDGKKTTFLIVLLLLSTIFQLVTLINHAINSSYDINSFLDVISVIIDVFILKQVFEVRRLDMD